MLLVAGADLEHKFAVHPESCETCNEVNEERDVQERPTWLVVVKRHRCVVDEVDPGAWHNRCYILERLLCYCT